MKSGEGWIEIHEICGTIVFLHLFRKSLKWCPTKSFRVTMSELLATVVVHSQGDDEGKPTQLVVQIPALEGKQRVLRLRGGRVPNTVPTVFAGNADLVVGVMGPATATITLTEGYYTATALAAELQTQIRDALSTAGEPGGVVNSTTVTYSATLFRFVVDTTATLTVDWAAAGSTATNMLGGSPSQGTQDLAADGQFPYVPSLSVPYLFARITGATGTDEPKAYTNRVSSLGHAGFGMLIPMGDVDVGQFANFDSSKWADEKFFLPANTISRLGLEFHRPTGEVTSLGGAEAYLRFSLEVAE